MQANRRPQKYAPSHQARCHEQTAIEITDERQSATQSHERYPMPFTDPHMKCVSEEIRHVMPQRFSFMVHRPASENPTCVRPPLAVTRSVRVPFLVGIAMMNAVRGHPEDR